MQLHKKRIAAIVVSLIIVGSVALVSQVRAQTFSITNVNQPTLQVGSTGQEVVRLQGFLSEVGYLHVPSGVPYGYFGNLTRNALIRYQGELRVTPTGMLDSATVAAMNTSLISKGWFNLYYPNATSTLILK